MKVVLLCFFVVLFFRGTEEQRTYKVKDECQCVPKNWDLKQVKELKDSMMRWQAGFEDKLSGMEGMVGEVMTKTLMETVKNITNMFLSVNNDNNYNSSSYNSSGNPNMTDPTILIKKNLPSILSLLGISSNDAVYKTLMDGVGFLEDFSMLSQQMNASMIQLTLLLQTFAPLTMQLGSMNTTIQMLHMKIMELEKKIESDGKMCKNPMLAFAGNKSIEAIITVSSRYGNNDNKTISKETLLVDSKNHWCADEPNLPEEFIQIDFNKTMTVAGMVVRGRGEFDQWISTFRVDIGWWNNGTSEWVPVKDEFGLDVKVFEGNHDNTGIKISYFPKPHMTKALRFVPLSTPKLPMGGNANKCTKLDVILCGNEEHY